jgi:copper/silver efflux system protein
MVKFIIDWCLNNRFLAMFFAVATLAVGYYCMQNIPVDAIPDIGEKQVIVFVDWPGRSPQDVEDQVTYALTVSLQGTPGVKSIRSMSGFGFSMVFVIFKDEVDYYWARSRVLERMSVATGRLPQGVVPTLGPDATALGQVSGIRSKPRGQIWASSDRCKIGMCVTNCNRSKGCRKSPALAAM